MIRATFESALPDWQRRLDEDEWYFARLRERISSHLNPAEAFDGLAEAAQLVLSQEDPFLATEAMQLLLDLVRRADTTERPKTLVELWDRLSSHVRNLGDYQARQFEQLSLAFRHGAPLVDDKREMNDAARMFDALRKAWLQAADDLDFRVVAPYRLDDRYDFPALVLDFGSPKGMVVLETWDEGRASAAQDAGFGFSTMDSTSYRSYDRERFVECLEDWGWCGDPDSSPAWYRGNSSGDPVGGSA
jgi:hypothetical protein